MKKLLILALAVSMSACASHVPIIDTKGVDMNAYNTDLTECQGFAAQSDVGASAGVGVGAGAIFGALLGAAIGGRNGASYGAKIGAVEGLGAGVGAGAGRQVMVVNRCMMGRGYKVLG